MRVRTLLTTGVFMASAVMGACSGFLKDKPTPISPVSPTDLGSVNRGPTPPVPQPAPPASSTCDDSKARWAIGERGSDQLLERARAAAGAASARFIRPGQAVTTEYLGSRLNLRLDTHEIVQSVSCG
jgi:hypothetical protein